MIDGVNFGSITSYTFNNITSNHTVVVYFTEVIKFRTTWDIPSDNYNLYLPFRVSTLSDVYKSPNELVYIDWGDGGNIQEVTALTTWTELNRKHLYMSAGTYQIKIWSASSTTTVAGKMPQWLGFNYAGIGEASDLISVDTPLLPMYNGTTVISDLSFIFNACDFLTDVCDRVTTYIQNITSLAYAFNGCEKLNISKDIFIDDEFERYTYFAGKTIDFTRCFARATFSGTTAGVAPSLWDYSGNFTGTECFLGNGNLDLTNVLDIPMGWGYGATYYTITINQSVGGYITPTGKNGNIYIKSGDSITLYITAIDGKQINDVLVNGASQGVISSYAFNNVTGNKTITATFV